MHFSPQRTLAPPSCRLAPLFQLGKCLCLVLTLSLPSSPPVDSTQLALRAVVPMSNVRPTRSVFGLDSRPPCFLPLCALQTVSSTFMASFITYFCVPNSLASLRPISNIPEVISTWKIPSTNVWNLLLLLWPNSSVAVALLASGYFRIIWRPTSRILREVLAHGTQRVQGLHSDPSEI